MLDSTMENLNGLIIADIKWTTTTAGPSPDNNKRTELFLAGCKKAMIGKACRGCFNNQIWDKAKAEFSHDPVIAAQIINKFAPNKFITICGGEPTDQISNLCILCKELKRYGFNILIYTWRKVECLLNNDFQDILPDNMSAEKFFADFNFLLKYIDFIIDGEFIDSLKIYNENAGDGVYSSIGSLNQNFYIIKSSSVSKKLNIRDLYKNYKNLFK